MAAKALAVCTSATVTLHDVVSSLEPRDIAADQVTLATSCASLPAGSLGAGYDVVLSLASEPGHHSVQRLGALAAALKPGGVLVVKETGAGASSEDVLKKSLLLSGLSDAAAVPSNGSGAALIVEARKPQWETGARAAISLRPRAQPAAQQAQQAQQQQPAAPSKAWVVSADDDGEEDEILDEEELLTEEDKQRPAPAAANDDCEVGAAGRKACKNCTCGRAEAGPDAKPAKLTKEMLDNPTSGCGSCALGDAFRCAACPYRGLPAFEMGKPIQLPSDFLAVDL